MARRKKIRLTIDDGPFEPEVTDKLLHLLRDYNVVAEFYIWGELLEIYPEAGQQIVDYGHIMQNHGMVHNKYTERTDKDVTSDIQKNQNAIFRIAKVFPTRVRPPYGAVDDRVNGLIRKAGLRTQLWDVDLCTNTFAVDQFIEDVESCKAEEVVVLAHGYDADLSMLEQAIKALVIEMHTFIHANYDH